MLAFLRHGKKRRRKKDPDSEVVVVLNRESLERMERLKSKITGFDPNQILGMALKCLEQKTDKIRKRQIRQSIINLNREGLSALQIAELLNEKGIPVVDEKTKNWEGKSVGRILDREKSRVAREEGFHEKTPPDEAHMINADEGSTRQT